MYRGSAFGRADRGQLGLRGRVSARLAPPLKSKMFGFSSVLGNQLIVLSAIPFGTECCPFDKGRRRTSGESMDGRLGEAAALLHTDWAVPVSDF